MGYTHSYLKLNFQEIRLSKSILINLLALIFFVYLKFVFYTNKWKLHNTNIPKKFGIIKNLLFGFIGMVRV